ncbi:hypothetical protein NIES593_03800 [Hydrococcus rivularis NIES-593]|uniref:Uncharacterized protein n=1 Tax=Hydrococcus rivularis NIES-593 TaxID=1921803 RepID=A0A1U7HRP8_9CYAN|nr:hypothetical protein [Hydrococcus rivularis]OKH26205.1 hypothetical protein NIES593_03800 [Hydrococcus rivularis NIES-593]
MKSNLLSKTSRIWLRLTKWKLRWAIAPNSYISTLMILHEIALEDLEFYAIYDPNIFSVAVTILMFKPIEYLLEVAVCLFTSRWQCDR